MKNDLALWSVMLVVVLSLRVNAQNHSIDWFTVDGGGGTSSADVYSLSGTIGQPDPGTTLAGGDYSLVGGFWALLATSQDQTGPVLSVALAPEGRVRLSWVPNAPGYVLQETLQLSRPDWKNVADGSTNPRLIPAGSSARYYRLQKP
ncbi:MAG: hypothetical protein JNN07_14300 [Verrucomicrobiales bacterium]|nr:hypothetical protein [Verrucomicrobiales bacterium]